MLSDLYSVEYRIIDNIESMMVQNVNYPHLFEFIKENFQTVELENFDSDLQLSIKPIEYEKLKLDPQFRLLIEHTASLKRLTILMYGRTTRKIEAVQKWIQSEIDRLG